MPGEGFSSKHSAAEDVPKGENWRTLSGIGIYIFHYSCCKAIIICLPLELFLPINVLLYTVVKGNPIGFMVSGFQVVCTHIG